MPYQGPGRYRHYKGGEYEVIGLALQEDHLDDTGGPEGGTTFVVYRPLTPGSLLENRQETYWARELSDFNAIGLKDFGLIGARFVKVMDG